MTACPCAQLMVREHSLRELEAAGFSSAEANRALDALPVATHNQRGRGSVLIGADGEFADQMRAEDLGRDRRELDVERDLRSAQAAGRILHRQQGAPQSRSSSKTSCAASSRAPSTSTPTFPTTRSSARPQVNYESIHKHDAFAEAFGLFGEFRRELRDGMHVDAQNRSRDLARHAALARRRLNAVNSLELWASPEPTFARIDATTRARSTRRDRARRARADDATLIADLGVAAARDVRCCGNASRPTIRTLRLSRAGAPARCAARVPASSRSSRCSITAAARATPTCSIRRFPLLFAEYAAAAARAFPWVRRWTPINEPLTTARFATLYGAWYPNMRDDAAFGRAIVQPNAGDPGGHAAHPAP